MSLAEILDRMQDKTALVVGDWIKDVYHFGRVERICPEAPVPVFLEEFTESREGGAANVFRQITELGVVGVGGLSHSYSVKQRWMVGPHMLLRSDSDRQCFPSPEDIRSIRSKVATVDVVVLSDYGKGWLTFDLCQEVIAVAQEYGIPVVVDPKEKDWEKFYGCTLICPNEKEMSACRLTVPSPILLKRGAKGMRLIENHGDYGRNQTVEDVPATARHVYDVTGAGDTVVAVVAAALAVGASKLEAATLAALAAGYVVGEVGTTVCPIEKLKELVNAR